MQIIINTGILIASYVIGSIPVGLIVVKLITGKDIRNIESGRTGGTNVYRAAGFGAGLFTAILDILKAACTVWIAKAIYPEFLWIHVLAPISAVIGHNYSIFLPERDSTGQLQLRGGAGGAAALGGAIAIWPPAFIIMFPVGLLIWWGLGYASITTLSVGLLTMIIFSIRSAFGIAPWEYIFYGVFVELLLVWALRKNISNLIIGKERRHGLPLLLDKKRKR